jgi:hypothetical protein
MIGMKDKRREKIIISTRPFLILADPSSPFMTSSPFEIKQMFLT